MKDIKEIYSPVYGCIIFDGKYEDYDRKIIDYEAMSSICKSLKIKQLKLLHKHIIDIAGELYKFSDELSMSDKEECNCKTSVIEAIKALNNIAEYLTRRALYDTNEVSRYRGCLFMKVAEVIEKCNSEKLWSLCEFEEELPDLELVASDLNVDRHRWFELATNVFSDMMSNSDCGCSCSACEYEAVTSITYRSKKGTVNSVNKVNLL